MNLKIFCFLWFYKKIEKFVEDKLLIVEKEVRFI